MEAISNTAEFGAYDAGPLIIDEHVHAEPRGAGLGPGVERLLVGDGEHLDAVRGQRLHALQEPLVAPGAEDPGDAHREAEAGRLLAEAEKLWKREAEISSYEKGVTTTPTG